MTSERPYLIEALYKWLVDNQVTPHLLVNAEYPGTQVPVEYVQDGQIVLNMSPNAIRDLRMTRATIQFKAAFPGVIYDILVPMFAVLAIYAKENNEGMFFEAEAYDPSHPSLDDQDTSGGSASEHPPYLRVVK